MTPPLTLELVAAVSGGATTVILTYVSKELRDISAALSQIPVHERTLYGTDHTPGLVERVNDMEREK